MIEIGGVIEHNALMKPTSDFFAAFADAADGIATPAGTQRCQVLFA